MLHPTVGLVRLPAGVLNVYSHVLNAMGPDRLLEPVVRGEVTLTSLPAIELDRRETLLIDPLSQDGGVGVADDSLGELLLLASEPIARELLFEGMLKLGAEPGEQAEILRGLVLDGLQVER